MGGMYDYRAEREKLFTERGQVLFMAVRDRIARAIGLAGAVTMDCALTVPLPPGWVVDSRELMACVDRLVELGELRELSAVAAEVRVFILP